jgi:U3 small nucleolar RNA-associated protein 24
MISNNDQRIKRKTIEPQKPPTVRNVVQQSSSMFFKHNESLKPPYNIIIDTNFINFSIQNKLEMVKAMVYEYLIKMDCLFAKCIPIITDCVMAELEKMGEKYRIALRFIFKKAYYSVARDPRFERLPCSHKGTYADDCIVNRVTQHKCYIVATCDRDLKRRIRKIPGF